MRLQFTLLSLALAVGCTDPTTTDGDPINDDFLSTGKADGGISEGSPDALGVLAVVNSLDRTALDNDVGLDARAAKNIANHRAGADATLDSADDNRFDTLAELDAVPYVGKIALARLLAYARTHGFVHAAPDGRQVASCGAEVFQGTTAVCGDAGWRRERPSLTGMRLDAAWTFGANDVWVAGDQGTILHYDGHTWTSEPTPVCEMLTALWGTSATNLWAVGDHGRIIHRTASGWQIVDSGTCSYLGAIWGTSANDVWVSGVGNNVGETLHGGTQGFAQQSTVHFDSLWGFASNDVWGVSNGAVMQWDGSAWSTRLQGHWDTERIWAPDPDHMFIAGYDWDKQAVGVWTFSEASVATPVEQTFSGSILPALHGSSANDVWLTIGEQLQHFDGTKWTYIAQPGTAELWALAASTPSDAWAVGTSGDLLHWNGTAWTTGNQAHALYGMWAASATNAWVASSNGVLHYDGQSWAYAPGVAGFFWNVWGTAASNVYAVGLFNKVAHYDGASWTNITMPTNGSWYAVAGTSANDIWVGGYQGVLAHFDGTTWTAPTKPTTRNINALYAVGPNNLWAATGDGLLHFDGTTWAVAGPLNTGEMLSVWGSSANDLWAVGWGVWHYDGNVWTRMLAAPSLYQFSTVWGSGPHDVWVSMGSELAWNATHLLHWDGETWTTHVNAAANTVKGGFSIGGVTWAAEQSGGIVRH